MRITCHIKVLANDTAAGQDAAGFVSGSVIRPLRTEGGVLTSVAAADYGSGQAGRVW